MIKRLKTWLTCLFKGHSSMRLEALGGADLASIKAMPSEIELARVRMCERCCALFWIPGKDVPEEIGNFIEYYEAMQSYKSALLEQMGEQRNGHATGDGKEEG